MRHLDPERRKKLRVAIRYLISNSALERGHQSRLAEHFDVSRQWVHQVVNQEKRRLDARALRLAGAAQQLHADASSLNIRSS